MFPEDKGCEKKRGGGMENVWRGVMVVSMICLLFCIVCIPFMVLKMNELQAQQKEAKSIQQEMQAQQEEMQLLINSLKLELAAQKTIQTDSTDDSEHRVSKRDTTTDQLSWIVEHMSILQGPPGPQGPPGDNGVPGDNGIPGIPGNPGVYVNTVDNDSVDVNPGSPHGNSGSMNGTGGSVYVRWGRNTCEDTSELVYEGVMGGPWYAYKGSGSNYQCLPLDPIYDDVVSGKDAYRGRMYGVEYQMQTFPYLSSVLQHDAVCAVCRVRSRGTVLMVPARNECPSQEWTREYYGYLMSQKYDYHSAEYVCIDRNPEGRFGSHADLNGGLLAPVEGRCGSLPCPPYVDGNELTCAVCTI